MYTNDRVHLLSTTVSFNSTLCLFSIVSVLNLKFKLQVMYHVNIVHIPMY